jgi:phage terminase large subunit-like protein
MAPNLRHAFFASLSPHEAAVLNHNWRVWGRPSQILPRELIEDTQYSTWLLLAGRGFGKTRVGAETIAEEAESGRVSRIALIGETAADVRDVIVEGESGILRHAKPWFKPKYEPSKRRITWPNGVQAFTYNATEPDQLRGPQHDFAWGDELAKWRYAQETFDNLQFGLRLGQRPRSIFTTTPRPIKIVRDMLMDSTVFTTRGRTIDNSDNLARSFIKKMRDKYEGTRLGRQELDAEVLDDMPGALWTRAMLEQCYVKPKDGGHIDLDMFSRIVIGVDPAVSTNPWSDETGIVVVGIRESNNKCVVLEDASGQMNPTNWAFKVHELYKKYRADKVVAEANQGGDLVEFVLKTHNESMAVRLVHATKGKYVRAEPVSLLYEKGYVEHLGSFPVLEDQMCQFTRDMDRDKLQFSPDHADALVWAITELKIDYGDGTAIIDYYKSEAKKAEESRKNVAGVASNNVSDNASAELQSKLLQLMPPVALDKA